MKKVLSKIILISILFSTLYFNSWNLSEKTVSKTIEDIEFLALIGDNFGNTYYEIKNVVESFGCKFTTIGMDDNCSSCIYSDEGQTFVIPELIISEVDQNVLSQFDSLIIPSGPHHVLLANNESSLNLIKNTYDAGLVIASICVGNLVLASVPNLVDGVRVADNFLSNLVMTQAGAIPVIDSSVVSDKRIVTSSEGPYNPKRAPTYEVFIAVVMIILGQSFIHESTINAIEFGETTIYNVTVEVNDMTDTYDNVSEVLRVSAYAYAQISNSYTEKINLVKKEDGIFTGNFTTLGEGIYQIEIEYKNWNGMIEYSKNIEKFTIFTPSIELDIILATIISLAIIVYISKKKK